MNYLKKITYITFILILLSCKDKISNTSKTESKTNSTATIEQKSNQQSNSIDSVNTKITTTYKNNFLIDKFEKKYDWSKIETKIDDEQKSQIVNNLKSQFDYFFDSDYYAKRFEEKLHFTDINNDNRIDVIFNGWSGGEPDITRFFIQTDNGFEKWFEVLQNPLNINIVDNQINEIIAIDYGCCDSYQVTISKYKVTDKLNLVSQTSYINWTDMNGTTIEPIKFEIIRDTYFIRDSPKIDNETENERFETKGNSIGEFIKGQKGIAYKSKEDSTGRVWWLMESEPLDSLQNSYFYNESKIKTSFIGWISSRYVKTINN